MDLALILINFILVFSVYQIFRYYQEKKELDVLLMNRFDVYPFYQIPILIMLLFFILGMVYLFMAVRNRDNVNIIYGAEMCLVSLLEMFYFYKTLVFYYNDERCILKNRMINYRNIRSIERNKVILNNGETYPLYSRCCRMLKEKLGR